MKIAPVCAAVLVASAAPQALAQALPAGPHAPAGRAIAGLVHEDVAGRALARFPHFDFVQSFYAGLAIEAAVDTDRHPSLVGQTADVWLCAHRDAVGWGASPVLVDVRGAFQTVTFASGGVQANLLTLDNGLGALSGDVGAGLGRALDVVIDMDRDGRLSTGDWVDGADSTPGLWLLAPTTQQGPLVPVEVLYSGGTWLGQDLYYPSNVASLGELPLVVVSHGNGHNYQWYDHIGYFLASYGYVVMSHQNNTVPGTETASTTTLTNTDYLLSNLATIAGGVLDGHVDRHRIMWIGHSRGGEGVARAYDRIFDGQYAPVNYVLSDIKLISSIAPTDFQGNANTNPHGVPYHLWTGGADSDVNGCASCNICQTFHLHERATGARSSISLHGVGHGAFHAGTGGLFATGPCLLTRADTHAIMKAHLLPLAEWHLKGNPAGREVLWRQWESFQSPGVPTISCVTVDLMHRGTTAQRGVIDDFETNSAIDQSSSGGAVIWDVQNPAAGRLDDVDSDFTTAVNEPMNGMTFSGSVADATSGMVFEWTGVDRSIVFELVPGLTDASAWRWLSFRACQVTRSTLTTSQSGDLDFSVRLRDVNGVTSTIAIGAYGGGIEEPYQRTGCGTGAGWANEWETIRIPLADFTRGASALDLTQLSSVDLLFGPSAGDAQGRIGLDELEFARD